MSRSSTLAMCMTLCFLAPARAEIITVTSDSGGTGGPDCTLRDAITAANTDTPTGGCPAGDGADTIELPVNATITLTEEDNETNGPNGLPSVTSVLTINGNQTTLQRDLAEDTPRFRIIHVEGGDLTLHDVSVSGGVVAFGQHHPAESGGGIWNLGLTTLTNCTVSGNTARHGGGIASFGTLTLTNCIVIENSASIFNGGGILSFGPLTVTNSIVSGNSAGQFGGGIYASGTKTLTNTVVSGNSAGINAGGIWNIQELVLENSTVSGNFADSEGGGIVNKINATLTLINSTVSGNFSAAEGGGIWNVGTLTLANSTINGNVGGILNHKLGTVTLTNSILANSTNAADCDNFGVVIDAGYNIVEDGTCISAPTSFSGDPMLGPLENNGGPTLTHALLEGSPAIDTIPVADCVVDTDQRGIPRPQGDGCDIGAYEVEESNPCADDDGLVTICHIPPGHSGNTRTIMVSVRALPAHLAHGDQCGPCADGLAESAGGPVTGSCCVTDGCFVLTEKDCAAIGGKYVEDGSRCVGPFDLAQLLGWWGPCEPIDPCHEVDADASGDIGPFDLAVLLGVWGPCPGF